MTKPYLLLAKEETPRESLLRTLDSSPVTARDLSRDVGLSEKDVFHHLSHLKKTLKAQNRQLVVQPAVCLDCQYIFQKRERLTRPGKCPVCRSTHLSEPLFSLPE